MVDQIKWGEMGGIFGTCQKEMYQLGRPRCRWEYNIKTHMMDVDWIYVAEG
jgi:hypothetical protein